MKWKSPMCKNCFWRRNNERMVIDVTLSKWCRSRSIICRFYRQISLEKASLDGHICSYRRTPLLLSGLALAPLASFLVALMPNWNGLRPDSISIDIDRRWQSEKGTEARSSYAFTEKIILGWKIRENGVIERKWDLATVSQKNVKLGWKNSRKGSDQVYFHPPGGVKEGGLKWKGFFILHSHAVLRARGNAYCSRSCVTGGILPFFFTKRRREWFWVGIDR